MYLQSWARWNVTGYSRGHSKDSEAIGEHTQPTSNSLEAAWQRKTKIYGSSWDISEAFDSVSRPLIRLAWERVGVPDTLMELDRDNRTVVRSNWVMEVWEAEGYACMANDGDPNHVCYINPERGTGQGDVSSPQTWVVFFDIILRTLELENEDSFEYLAPDGSLVRAPDSAYADDLFSIAATHSGLQRKANVMSTCAMVLGLKIAQAKLRVFSMDWTASPSQRSKLPTEYLTVYAMGGWPIQSR